jgi:hypothetical protein
MLATILISIFLAVLVFLAVRHLIKHGTCASCGEKGSCHSDSSQTSDSFGCSCCHEKENTLRH